MELNQINSPANKWQLNDSPRQKLALNGIETLSDSELLAILINSGSKSKSALDLAKELLTLAQNNLSQLGKFSLNELQKIKGLGETKSSIIKAAIELGKRREISTPLSQVVIRSSYDIASYLKVSLKDYNYEVFAVIYLNQANRIKSFEIISKGGITGTVADPRVILKRAVEQEATSLILSHNHPSGNLKPSGADEALTYKIKQAASYFDIRVLDHIIISEDGFFSFADEGLL